MPGSPDPTSGNEYVDAAVAGGIALAVVATLSALGDSVGSPRRFAVGVGIGYALVCFGACVLPRLFYDAFVFPSLVALGGVPAYLYASFDSLGALVGLSWRRCSSSRHTSASAGSPPL